MNLKTASIFLVGLCNEEPLSQILLGRAIFTDADDIGLHMALIDPATREEIGSAKHPFFPTYQWKKQGEYGLLFPRAAGGVGVMINLNKNTGRYRFITGVNRGDDGSSGPIVNGGPELVDVLDTLFGFATT